MSAPTLQRKGIVMKGIALPVVFLGVMAAAVSPECLAADSNVTPLTSRIDSIGLFKNGLAVVRRTLTLPGEGSFILTDLPEPVHGTFWIESIAPVETRMTTHEFAIEGPPALLGDPARDLAGLEVVMRLKSGDRRITGRVLAAEDSCGPGVWDRSYETWRSDRWGWWAPPSIGSPSAAPSSRFIALEKAEGMEYVDASTIASIEVRPGSEPVMRSRPVMMLRTVDAGPKPIDVTISYLTKGIAWSPSYRIDVTNSTMLALELKAVIRNELEDLDDVSIELISGFPSVEFSHVLSPMTARTTWASFFRQLNQQRETSPQILGNVMMQQHSVAPMLVPPDELFMQAGAGIDLHYEAIGRHSLREGDSLILSVAAGSGRYERIVDWLVPDTRDEFGRQYDEWRRRENPEEFDDSAWDAIRFRNPLDMPMTTAPAMIVAGGRFGGQHLSSWLNPGASTTLHVTKALSIRTHSTEIEESGEREIVNIGGRTFRHPIVRGELTLENHRDEAVTVHVRRRFSGELLEAELSPETRLLEVGVYSVNPRQELNWTITLEPGQRRTLTYRYSVLVAH
jgi:hypothetical protein